MEKLLKRLRQDYPSLLFTKGTSFCWSPQTRQVFYTRKRAVGDVWSVLHETSHALLNHTSYTLDLELMRMEVDAWETAKKLAKKYAIAIDEDHIQDCLDSYRDWLYKRSICPSCGNKSLQQEDELGQYQCFNCHSLWSVSPSRFRKSYRQCVQNNKSLTTLAANDLLKTSLG